MLTGRKDNCLWFCAVATQKRKPIQILFFSLSPLLEQAAAFSYSFSVIKTEGKLLIFASKCVRPLMGRGFAQSCSDVATKLRFGMIKSYLADAAYEGGQKGAYLLRESSSGGSTGISWLKASVGSARWPVLAWRYTRSHCAVSWL